MADVKASIHVRTRGAGSLQTRAVNDLVVDNELTTTVVDNEGTDRATAVRESVTDALEQAALRDDRQALFDVSGLGHGDDAGVVTEVQDAVGLIDGAEHGLHHDGGRGVGDEAGLLLQLAGEEVNAQVAVLASLRRHRDTDHLAGTALQDEDVADADEVARDRDGLAGRATVARLDDADLLADAIAVARRAAPLTHHGLLAVVVVLVVEGMQDVVSGTLHAAAERVVVALVVVVTHLASWGGVADGGGFGDLDFGRGGVAGAGGLVGPIVRDVDGLGLVALGRGYGLRLAVVRDVDFVGGRGPTTVLSLSEVKLVLEGLVVDRCLGVVGVAEEESMLSNTRESRVNI